jgi:hypothetical protein
MKAGCFVLNGDETTYEKEEGRLITKSYRIERSAFAEVFVEILLTIVFQRLKEVIWNQVLFPENLFDVVSQASYLRSTWRDKERTVQVDQAKSGPYLDPVLFTKLSRKSASSSFPNNDGGCFHICSLLQGFDTALFIAILRR